MSMSKLTTIMVLWAMAVILIAAPHSFLPLQVNQPGGQELTIYASGDEFHNWLHDKDFYTIMRAEDGSYVYAEPGPVSIKAGSLKVGTSLPSSRGIAPGLNLSKEEIAAKYDRYKDSMRDYSNGRSPHTGAFNNLVVFIKFLGDPDFTQPITTYDNMFNNATMGANSMKNYFQAASYQQLNVDSFFFPEPNGNVILTYIDTHPRNYYRPISGSNPIGYDPDDDNERMIREHTMLANCMTATAPQIPTTINVDGDNDGYVDNVCFIVQGSPDGWAELLWPHRWTLYGAEAYVHGAMVWDFNLQLESSLSSSGASVLSHEMFHSLGAPDLYRYNDTTITPIGSWDLMSSNTNPPQHMSAWMKYRYGQWLAAPPILSASGEYTLSPVASSSTNNIYRIPSWRSTESYVVEYRRPSGIYDGTIPGPGLLVYRLDARRNGNAGGPPDELYIYRPGGSSTTTNGILSQAAFSADTGRTEISEVTTPRGFMGNNASGGLNIYDIGIMGETITFKVKISDIQLTFPHGGEGWFAGSNKTLTWKAKSTTGSVKIEYSSDGEQTWNLVTASTLNNGSYLWQNIPMIDSDACHIRITHLTTGQTDSNSYPFTVISQIATPEPISPGNANPATPTNPTLSWTSVAGASAYTIQLSLDQYFGSFVLNLVSHPHTTFACSALLPFTTYYWQVAAESDIGSSPFSPVQQFTTGHVTELPSVPALSSPANNATNVPMNPHLVWGTATLADTYQLQISTSPYFANLDYQVDDITGTSHDCEPLLANTSYYWRVRSINAGGVSNFSGNCRFTTGSIVDANDIVEVTRVNKLGQNFPNPFFGNTRIEVEIKDSSLPVQVGIYNQKGQLIRNLFNGISRSANLNLNWDGKDERGMQVGSGIYLYKMQSGDFRQTRKLLLVH